ncbi:extracellular solute-binding protein [Thermosynechococcaceae cyanobacterium Okahandja]
MQRRDFCQGLVALGAMALSGCQGATQGGFTVHLLQKSLPPQLIRRFRQTNGIGVTLRLNETPQHLAEALTHTAPSSAVFSLGDAWLKDAVGYSRVYPIPKASLEGWSRLAPPWATFLQAFATEDAVWGVPYRWGATVMVYRRDFFAHLGWEPTNWDALWHPDLEGHFSLLNSPREVIGLTLKALGGSYNDPPNHPDLRQRLAELRQRCRFFSSDAYLQPLILGSTQLAVGWSSDILPLVQRQPETFGVVVPAAGTALWADLWVCPQPPDAAATAWLQYWWQPTVAEQLSQFTTAISPVLTDLRLAQADRYLHLASVLERSEALLPLSAPEQQIYDYLWEEVFLGQKWRDRPHGQGLNPFMIK